MHTLFQVERKSEREKEREKNTHQKKGFEIPDGFVFLLDSVSYGVYDYTLPSLSTRKGIKIGKAELFAHSLTRSHWL